ncbi:MAG TPA: GIY-YIG nuclease family protein [Candidatus Udaeobacter sp.]|nr:GIY-YIG nuclease family protein [Candidatus Udaeobacter sp.]
MKAYYVYIMTNRSRVVLYIGVTKSLERRLWFHGNASAKSFTNRYKVGRLGYYEKFDNPRDAISREKEIKGWRREKKNDLVRRLNPRREDLGKQLFADRRRGPSPSARPGMTPVDLE